MTEPAALSRQVMPVSNAVTHVASQLAVRTDVAAAFLAEVPVLTVRGQRYSRTEAIRSVLHQPLSEGK
jgi:hypothetical protein